MAEPKLLSDDMLSEIVESLSFHEWTRLCGQQLSSHIAAQAAELKRTETFLTATPVLKEMHYTEENGVEVVVEHWAVKVLAASLLDSLLNGREIGAANFVTMTIQTEAGPLEVTIRKAWGGITPADKIAQQQKLIDEQAAEIERCHYLMSAGHHVGADTSDLNQNYLNAMARRRSEECDE